MNIRLDVVDVDNANTPEDLETSSSSDYACTICNRTPFCCMYSYIRSTNECYSQPGLTCLSIQLVTYSYLLLPAEESGLGLALHRIGYVRSTQGFMEKS
jgi:hypothetical protein